VGILESRTFLRQRIERLLDFHPPRKAGLTLASLFSVAAFAALALPMGQAPPPAEKPEPAAAEPASAPPAAPSAPATVSEKDGSSKSQIIASKLNRIHLDIAGPWQHLPLSEVVKILRDQSIEQDNEKRGISFILGTNGVPGAGVDPATGLPIAWQADMPAVSVTIDQPLKDLPLADVLDVIVKAADKPIQYSIQDYGVVFEAAPLYFRTFQVDPGTFELGMRESLGLPEGTNSAVRNFVTTFRRFFGELGVDISPPKSIFYGDREGVLLVYATLADLDIIEKAVRSVTIAPPQVKIKAVFIELPKAEVEAFWEEFGPTNGPPQASSARTATLTHSQAAAQLDRWKSRGGATNILRQVQVTTESGRQTQVSVEDVGTTSTEGAKGRPGGLISPEGRPSVLISPEGAAGARTSQAKLDNVAPILSLVIIPYVTPDHTGVQMGLVADVLEFIGYDDPGPFAPILDSNAGPATATLPLPHFRVRPAVNTVEVQDGQTVVLGYLTKELPMEVARKMQDQIPVLGDLPVVGRLFRSGMGRTNNTDALIFVTPTIVDPAGNPIHPQNKQQSR
jgi:hypothetical protein